MAHKLFTITEDGDVLIIGSGNVIGIRTIDISKGKTGDMVEINKGESGENHIRTRRCFIDESKYSLNAFKPGDPPQPSSTPVPKAPVEKIGQTFIAGLTKEELQMLHEHHQAVADMLFKKIVQIALKER